MVLKFNILLLTILAICGGFHYTGLAKAQAETRAKTGGCSIAVQKAEQAYRMPKGLLEAISLTESGRFQEGERLSAWPWSLNVQGKGRYFPSKETAVAEAKRLWEAGIKSIDVGCMQINLKHHPEAFTSFEDAFDPEKNVTYGAQFLSSLEGTHRSWSKAIAHYHSASPQFNRPYQDRVHKLWAEVLKQDHTDGSYAVSHPELVQETKKKWFATSFPLQRAQFRKAQTPHLGNLFSVSGGSSQTVALNQPASPQRPSQQPHRTQTIKTQDIKFFPLGSRVYRN